MPTLYKYFFILLFVGSLTASAGAQVRFNVYANPYSGPGLTVSVGNSGYRQQPVYNTGYVVYPAVSRRHRRGRPVVVAPYYNGGYNQGYNNNGNCNNNSGYNNNGYYNQGYNAGYNPGYGYYQSQGQGYYSNGRCR